MVALAARLARVEAQCTPIAPAILPSSPLALAAACGLVLDSWQHAALRSTWPRELWNCSRQTGKSTLVALLALFVALSEPGSLGLLLAPAERQAAELLRKVQDLYRALGHVVPTEAESVLKLELQGGSRILALPGKDASIRGFSAVRLLAVDEAARVPDSLYHAVTPMLAVSGGRLIALSTPWGKRGWWYQAWTEGGRSWDRREVPALACPRIPRSFLEEERASLPALVYASEYECQFVDTEDAAFRTEDLDAALCDGEPFLLPEIAGFTA